MSLSVTVLTLFPEMFPGLLSYSLLGKALEQKTWTLRTVNIRDFALDRHRSVDDAPFGGGPGMVMKPDVLDGAIKHAVKGLDNTRLLYMSPKGQPFTQSTAAQWSDDLRPLVLLCGRYEGVDQRVLDFWGFEDVSLGDFVLTGGEVAAMTVVEVCVRLLPGVLGDETSKCDESFSHGLLEYPHYTKPRIWRDLSVPDILLSGHHEQIQNWKQAQSEQITKERRPDLWDRFEKTSNMTRRKKEKK